MSAKVLRLYDRESGREAHFRLQSGQEGQPRVHLSFLEQLDQHPVLTVVGGVGAGAGGVLAQFGDLHPTLKAFAGAFGAGITLFSLLYKPVRKAWSAIKTYVDPEKGAAAQLRAEFQQTRIELQAIRKEQALDREELGSNTRLTHQLLGEVTRTHQTILEHGDAREMVAGLEGQLTVLQEKIASTEQRVKDGYEQIHAEFNGLGESLRKRMSELDERLRKLEEK